MVLDHCVTVALKYSLTCRCTVGLPPRSPPPPIPLKFNEVEKVQDRPGGLPSGSLVEAIVPARVQPSGPMGMGALGAEVRVRF